jgi:hypothetical protein
MNSAASVSVGSLGRFPGEASRYEPFGGNDLGHAGFIVAVIPQTLYGTYAGGGSTLRYYAVPSPSRLEDRIHELCRELCRARFFRAGRDLLRAAVGPSRARRATQKIGCQETCSLATHNWISTQSPLLIFSVGSETSLVFAIAG